MVFRRDDPLGAGEYGPILQAVREAADHAGFGILVTLSDETPPRHVFVNEGAARIFGCELSELLDKTVWDFLAPEEIPRLAAMQQRRISGEENPGIIEVIAVRKDGRRIPVEGVTRRVELGGRQANVSFLLDITSRREAEAALRQSEARFRSVVESSPDGVTILRGPKILYLNPAAARMLGYDDPAEAIGQSITDVLHPDDVPRAAQRIEHTMRTGERHREPAEYRSRRRDGTELTVEISSIHIDYEGSPAVLGFARDITERKAIQSRLIQADRLAAVGTLAAGVAHEINNPLTYVSLSLKYLEREIQTLGVDANRTRKLLARIKEASHGVDRVGTIVRDLKTFARADDEDATGPVDLTSVIDDSMKMAENEIRHRARLTRDLEEVPRVFGNASRLEQVFLNLLVNAAQALPDGGDPTRDQIGVSLRCSDDGQVVAEVSDTGAGIPESIRSRIFDPYFTTKPTGIGTGLGLPICQAIVTGYGGSIEIASRVNHGTTVRVTLRPHPEQTDTESARRQVLESQEVPRRARVLVIDDEPFVGRLLGKLLGPVHDVTVTVSGNEAMEVLQRQGPFDAIVCDLIMPGMSGMDVYEQVRKQFPGLERRMVFMTGGAFVHRVADFLAAIDNPKLDKPFETEHLLSAIQSVLAREANAVRGAGARPLTDGSALRP